MLRRSLLLLVVAWTTWAAPAAAAEPSDPVLDALQVELDRAMVELAVMGDLAPYYIALQVIQVDALQIDGEEGGLQGYRPSTWRMVHADVRVGSPQLDSTHALRDVGLDDAEAPGRELIIADDADLLSRTVWREIEARYRVAVDRWQRVQSDQQVLVAEEATWDLAPAEPVTSLGRRASLDAIDLPEWEEATRQASAVFAATDLMLDPSVSISGEAETRWLVSSEGHRIREGATRFRASIAADTTAEDGTSLEIYRSWDSATPDGLPDLAFLVEQASDVVQQLRDLREAPEQGPYTGPALLSGRAAAVFFHEIFGHRVEGHRLKRVDDAQTFVGKVGQPILPAFLSVVDDPTIRQYAGQDLRGAYLHDDQGVPTERVTLVRDGVLEGFLESRSPVLAGRSNAHGRRQAGHDVVTRQGNLLVEASETIPEGELREALLEQARAAGLDYALIIDDIDGGFTFTDRDIPNAFQIDVVLARRIYVDGRDDQLVRGVDLIGTPLQTFGRITAAGTSPEVFNGTCGAESGWVPVAAASPALLVSQIETQRKLKGQTRPPLLPPPSSDVPPSAADGSDPLLDSLVAGLERATAELRLDDAAPPSRAMASVFDGDSVTVYGEWGLLGRVTGRPGRPGRVEVVVGDYVLNSSRIDGGTASLPSSVTTPRFVADDVPVAVARDLWLTTDDSYKSALARIAVKTAARHQMGGEPPPPDWTDAPVIVSIDRTATPQVDQAALERIAALGSAPLRDSRTPLRAGQVYASETQGRVYLADTEGVRIVQGEGYAAVYAYADVLRDDGVRLFDRLTWVARTTADLPSAEEVAAAVSDMAESLSRRTVAPAIGYYEGPVIFEGEAAADLFRYLLPPEVRGTPPTPEAGRTYTQQTRGGPRLGRRVLPGGWSVTDDPTSVPDGLAGGYEYDREGVAGRAVQVVDDGYVRDLLMTRVPRRDKVGSNGHARGGIQAEWSSRLSSWTVRPARMLPTGRFERTVQQLRRAADQPAVLVVRRLEQGWEGDLPMPTDAVWRFPDGSEQPVLTLEFQGVDRRTLRAIEAASGGMQVMPYLAPFSPWSRAPTTAGIPMVVTAPERVVIAEMEAVFPGTGERRPVYPMPNVGPIRKQR